MAQKMRTKLDLFRALAFCAVVITVTWPFLVPLTELMLRASLAIYALCLVAILLVVCGVIPFRDLLAVPFGRTSLVVVVLYCAAVSFFVYGLTHGEGT
jgi:hypothetical protein